MTRTIRLAVERRASPEDLKRPLSILLIGARRRRSQQYGRTDPGLGILIDSVRNALSWSEGSSLGRYKLDPAIDHSHS